VNVPTLPLGMASAPRFAYKHRAQPKVGEVPSFRASDTDTDLPTVSTDLFNGFQYLKHRSSLQNENL
jgi:hypothetical protein